MYTIQSSIQQYGYINRDGQLVIPCQWDKAGSFQNGVAEVKKNDVWYYINASGEMIVRKYDNN